MHFPSAPNRLSLAVLATLTQMAVAQSGFAQAAPAAAAPASAASSATIGLQTVTVTAERHAADIQKTSIAMQVVNSDEISQQGLSNGQELLKNMANVEIQQNASGNIIAIRGMGTDIPPGMAEGVVSTNYDGVYNFRAEMSTLGFFDLDRVEVLRGPQGTLYGRNAGAGAVNFITRDPSLDKRKGDASLEAGNYGLVRGEVGFNIPLSDTLALRASAASISREGFLSDGTDDAKGSGGRIKVLWKPTPGLRLLAGAERIQLGGKGANLVSAANANHQSTILTAAEDPNGTGDEKLVTRDFHASKVWAQADIDVGLGMLTVLPAYQIAKGTDFHKYDAQFATSNPLYYETNPGPAIQKSIEVRLANKADSPVQWVAGVYGYHMTNKETCLHYDAAGSNCTGLDRDDKTISKAAFGQVTVPLAPGLRAIGGLRVTSDYKRAENIARLYSTAKFRSVDGKVGVEYDVSPDAMAYATLATAYRPGGFNSYSQPQEVFESEKLRSFELGLKSRWLDNTLQFNASAFAYNYKNYQAMEFYQDCSTCIPSSTIYNIPHQYMQGLEADTQLLLAKDAGLLHATVTWLHASLGDLVLHSSDTNYNVTDTQIKGEVMPHAPRFTVKGGYELPFTLASDASVTLRADLRYVTRQYVTLAHNSDTLQKSYAQADLSTQYRSPDDVWGINFYVKNVTNYVPKTGYFSGWVTVGEPRTYGAVLTTHF